MKFLNRKFIFPLILVLSLFSMSACVTTTQNPDGTVTVSEPDYEVIQLSATAAVAAWAATQKNGITQSDAQTILGIVHSIEDHHLDGTEIDPNAWSVAIAQQVPKRWQALSVVMVQLAAHELKKYGVATEPPVPGSVGAKIMDAIVNGVKIGLAPYAQA